MELIKKIWRWLIAIPEVEEADKHEENYEFSLVSEVSRRTGHSYALVALILKGDE